MKYFKVIGLLLLASVCALRAQVTSYYCDFEDAAEVAQWTLNYGPRASQCANQWYVGAPGSFGVGSQNGLYISSDNGATASYNASNHELLSTYRELTLAAGTYTLRFDWMCLGSGSDGVFVYWLPSSDPGYTKIVSNSAAQINLSTFQFIPSTATRYRGSYSWKTTTMTITSDGTPGRLLIVWYNSKEGAVLPAAAVDNIEIYPGSACAAPTGLSYDANTTTLSWRGSAGSYEVMVFNQHTGAKTDVGTVTGTSAQLGALTEEGAYQFYVRSACDTEKHSAWATYDKFVWLPGVRCIDYLDLTPNNTGFAKCYSGSTDDIKRATGQIDYGYADERSQHTIHYMKGETDPRTGNKLKTIPDGEIASVRLGGYWDLTGNMSSTVEYQYNVQAGVSDLLELKYATILEYADYHGEDEEARFKLEILRGTQVIDQCAQGDFKAGYGETGSWHTYSYYGNGTSERIMYWCDWQTITVSLRNYIGQTLTIRLTAYSCTATVHIGYAYFTLNCRGGGLEGISCGDFSTDHFEAPEGFNYRWYKEGTTQTLGTGRTFGINPDDANIYLVDVIDRNKPQCFYTLTANPNPRYPHAVATATPAPANCQNIVRFSQDSKIVYINRATYEQLESDEPIESVRWNFEYDDDNPDSRKDSLCMDANVTHVYPQEGGTFTALCIASMSGGLCEDTVRMTFTLPDLLHTDEYEQEHTCEARHVDSHDRVHLAADSTYYIDTVGVVTNRYGCEGLQIRTVYFHQPYDTLYEARMCEGGTYRWRANGQAYTASIDTTLALRTIYGCDSTIRLHLHVDPALTLNYPDTVFACTDRGALLMDYTVLTGMLDSVFVRFDSAGIAQGFLPQYDFGTDEPVSIPIPAGARPDNYHVVVDFSSELCPYGIVPMLFQTWYSTSIVMQNSGFIALYNEDYNGGYRFSRYEWLRNGERRPEWEQSYVPTSADDLGAEYVILLTREGEDYAIPTCAIRYDGGRTAAENIAAEVLVWPTLARPSETLTVSTDEPFTLYTVTGMPLASHGHHTVTTRTLTAPSAPGVYLLRFHQSNQTVRILVR
ncbi:MAG: hypothetical protein IJ581_03155 [Paludibacteraceae bacterium]|nr:hypothetical protein [Paludibacteraceae bacterium]